MVLLSKACKPDSFESCNSLKLSFAYIWSLGLNFADCESFLESNPPDILALCETNLYDLIDSRDFSVRGYRPLIEKDILVLICMVYQFVWRKEFVLRGTYLQKTLQILTYVFLYQSLSLSLCTVFVSISSNIDEVLSINPSAKVFVFEDFYVHHKDWLTYSGGTERSG